MSPSNDNKMSSAGIVIVIILLQITGLSGCFPARRLSTPETISDRLLNLLIQQQLPFDEPGSALQGEVERCGEWLREQLVKNPAETFRFDFYDNLLIAESTGLNRRLVPDLANLLNNLNAFFHVNSSVSREFFTKDFISQRIRHPKSQKQITELIELDKRLGISELGGVVIADPEKEHMEFYVIQSENERWIRQLEKSSDPETFARTLHRIRPKMPFLQSRAQRTIDTLESSETDISQKQVAIDSFMELLLFYSKYSYILDQGSQYAAIARLGLSGIYMGLFHVHPEDNPPSYEDKIGSILRKNFVLVPVDQFIDVHYLDFSGDLRKEPLVVRFQRPVN